MRFVLAVGVILLSGALFALGILQRTVWLGPDSYTLSTAFDDETAVSVIDSDVLKLYPDRQRIRVEAAESEAQVLEEQSTTGADAQLAASEANPLVVVYAPNEDIRAWIGDTSYSVVDYRQETESLHSVIIPGSESEIPDPRSSDLWYEEFVGEDLLQFTVVIPENYSLMITSASGQPGALKDLSITWTLDNSTPLAGPAFLGGGILLSVGLFLYYRAFRDWQAKRKPRRKGPKPVSAKKAIGKIKQAPVARGRRTAKRVPVLAGVTVLAALTLSACSASYWPQLPEAAPTLSQDQVLANGSDTGTPGMKASVSSLQFERIISSISTVIEQADEELDAQLIRQRYAGPALDFKLTNYQVVRNGNDDYQLLPTFDPTKLQLFLPQQAGTWPRHIIAVFDSYVEPNLPEEEEPEESADAADTEVDDSLILPTSPPAAEEQTENIKQLLLLVQETPRDNYKIHYQVDLFNSVPIVASAVDGSEIVSNQSRLTRMSGVELIDRYAEIMLKGDEADEEELFSKENDHLRLNYGIDFKTSRISSMKSKAKYATLAFRNTVDQDSIIGFWTADAGAIFFGTITEYEVVRPSESDATVSAAGAARILHGKSSSTRGFEVGYGQQVLLYLPPLNSDEKITLIGYSQAILSANDL